MFIHLPGRSKEDAFRIGHEIAEYITSKCPPEVILKFEKVYDPCILVTKKRYVGNSYETEDQIKPHLDAKGIEMIRRDQCPMTMKLQEKVLRIIFETRDMSLVKEYLRHQWYKIHQGGDSLPLKDFLFRKKVRYGKYSANSMPPGAVVAMKACALDEMAIPPYNWRVSYVVVCGNPGAPLRDLVVTPEDYLRRGNQLRINSTYYIGKCINPALNRVLSLCGADVALWYRNMSKPKHRIRHIVYDTSFEPTIGLSAAASSSNQSHAQYHVGTVRRQDKSKKQQSMDQYTSRNCIFCGAKALSSKNICQDCFDNPAPAVIGLHKRMNDALDGDHALKLVCQKCSQKPQLSSINTRGQLIGPDSCSSTDCSVFFERCRCITRIEDFQDALKDLEDISILD